jgi:hypothetical protein
VSLVTALCQKLSFLDVSMVCVINHGIPDGRHYPLAGSRVFHGGGFSVFVFNSGCAVSHVSVAAHALALSAPC